ncbi:L-lactate dehydrogenase [uncultured Gilvimarinus sp.]|uniref:L-lactate dehydrogenase n=1 Tax=uncultured Gilvimarinus sp. TaxID=1689143 RepID=UPI0030EF014A
MIPASVSDYRLLAKKRLPKFLFEYIDGGAFSESTLARNNSDFQQLALRQRVLRDVSNVSTASTLLGQPVNLPLALGPVGIAGFNARRGEVQAAQAAEQAGVPFCLSTVSACSIEEVRTGTQEGFWFQLYMMRDRGFLQATLDRAWAAGCRTLVFTVDMPVPATRYRDIRSGLSGGTALQRQLTRICQVLARPRWALDVGIKGQPLSLGNIASALGDKAGIDEFWRWLGENFDASVTWKSLETIRQHWHGKLVIKGILDPDDAREAAKLGADGIVVSNHGGRQLDGAPSSIVALPHIVEAVAGELDILLDSGVRSGLDIVRAVALGASGVIIGRPWVYGLAARGGAGVSDIIAIYEREVRVAMALTGCTSIAELNRDILTSHNLSPSALTPG